MFLLSCIVHSYHPPACLCCPALTCSASNLPLPWPAPSLLLPTPILPCPASSLHKGVESNIFSDSNLFHIYRKYIKLYTNLCTLVYKMKVLCENTSNGHNLKNIPLHLCVGWHQNIHHTFVCLFVVHKRNVFSRLVHNNASRTKHSQYCLDLH